MNDSTRIEVARRYADIPYPPLVHPHTHPRRLAAVARLFGLRPPEPTKANVLELGSCDGANLIRFAKTLPQATFLGLELDPDAVQRATKVTEEQGLQSNLAFEAADLLDKKFGDQAFDYIIAHGFLSWVDEPVQQRMMEVCRDHLTPDGIAMISYNVMPGCATKEALRRLLLLELEEADQSSTSPLSTDAQLDTLTRVFSFFEAAIPKDTPSVSEPHATKLLQSIGTLQQKHPQVLLHDEAGAVFDPYYFLQFAQWASEMDISYIADAHFVHDWMDCYPRALKQAIVEGKFSRLKAIQYADYVLDTHFRSSLVCHADHANQILPAPDVNALLELHVRTLKNEAELKAMTLPISDVERTLVDIIGRQGERGLTFADAWTRTLETQRLADDIATELYPRAARLVLQMVCAEHLELSLGPATP